MSSLLILALSVCALPFSAAAGPAIFIFGDSTVDVGTNNYINSTFQVNHRPYGIDFPGRIPTGRYSNGFNSADAIVKKLGFMKSPPPFLAIANKSVHTNLQIVRGVNFASGGSGLLYATGFGRGVVPLSEQIQQFRAVRANLNKLLGAAKTESFLKISIVFISTGSNDIFQEFFLTGNATNPEYITSLKCAFEDHLKALYSLGARKFAIASIPALGCCPIIRAANEAGACSDDLNNAALSFYSAIEPMLQSLSSELPEMKYSLGNTYKMITSFLLNPGPSGLSELRSACCGGGKFNAQLECNQTAAVCANRDKYLFWDQYHPTQAASALAAETLYNGTAEFVTPINFKQLVEAC